MKKAAIILSVFALIASSCGTTKTAKKGKEVHRITNKDVEKHCKGFIGSITSGNFQKSLAYFAPEYVKQQHDDMLGGRTNQFLREFLSGTNPAGKFVVPENLADIKKITIKEAHVNLDFSGANAVFVVKLTTGEQYSVNVRLSIGPANRLYFWGAMG